MKNIDIDDDLKDLVDYLEANATYKGTLKPTFKQLNSIFFIYHLTSGLLRDFEKHKFYIEEEDE